MSNAFFFYLFTLLFSMLFGIQSPAQGLNASDSLYRQIAKMDSTLFGAFNSRNVETFGSLLSKDLEFYHDKGGLTDYTYTMESLKRTAALNNGLRRDLVPGSMEVYPIGNFGAVQLAAHTFCHLENGKNDCGTFKFIHLWKRTPEGWKLARVISYNH